MSPMPTFRLSCRPLRPRPLPALLLVLAGSVTPALAQPATPDNQSRVTEEVFVTATVAPVPTSSVTRSVAAITRADIEELGLRSIIEALRLVPGVDARARGPRDVQTDFSIRGATFGQHLVLADGMRLNNSQSGHHNGEIPLPSVAIDRVEIVSGAGSAVHGADALGGTINVITRRDAHALATVAVGQHGLFDAQASAAGGVIPAGWTVAGWTSRSSGFMFDRDFALGGIAVRGDAVPGLTVDVRHQRRAFGANGFYGNSPSKEWTDQTLGAARWQRAAGAWTTTSGLVLRNHGDHFRWDINRPGFAENRHRTNAVDVNVETRRSLRGAVIAFGGSAGADRVRSSNLGNHDYARASGFAELQLPVTTRATLQTGLRIDNYSTFGHAISPTASIVTTLAPGLRARASAGHAFRIPTFTELFYSDPNSVGRADLRAERGWTVDGGLDWSRDAWAATLSIFGRWDEDVIDFVRPAPGQRFQATNVRDVTAAGVEASVSRRWSRALVRVSYAGLRVDAPALTMESRYVLEYARHQTGVSIVTPIARGVRLALNLDHRARRDGQNYALVGARLSRAFGRLDLFLDGANLLNESYREIAGVVMPGRWVSGGVTIR
jgi:outer membrane cobalamin receptor